MSKQAGNDIQITVKRLIDGDSEAMRNLYAHFGSYVYTIAYSLTSDESEASEITQDTFVKIWKSIGTYDEALSSLRTWIAKIARNTAIDAMRRKRPERDADDPDLLLNRFSDEKTPENGLLEKEDSKRVGRALQQLPDNQREVLMLAYYSGMSQTEIAEKTGEPLGTVKSRIRLGLIKMKELLE